MSEQFDTPFYDCEFIGKALHLYEGGMPITDIGMCLGMSDAEVNDMLDHVLPYL